MTGLARVLAGLTAMVIATAASGDVIRTHGFNDYNELSYDADFEHLNYVNPDAPKGGEISLWAPGTFDSFNPYSRKGRAAVYSTIHHESLLASAPTGESLPGDTYGEGYGLLAHSLEYPEDKSWVIFYMRPEARFSDGSPVTAHDVVFSHNLLLEQGLPSYAQGVSARVTGAEALDDHTVKFTFADGISRRSLIDQVGGVPVFSKAWYDETGARLDESRLDPGLGSGPYILDSYDINRRVVYKRRDDYWGADLPINRGRNNFDRIRIEYFADDSAAFEAFKAGEYTFRAEGNSKQWATGYDFPALKEGYVIREELPDGNPPNNTGLIFNLGRETLQDKRVRQAISLAYNFEWTNASLQYGLFKQRESFAQGTPAQANGAPEGAELEFLKSLGDLVPEALLTEPPAAPHTSSEDRLNDRGNLRRAMRLLDDAGWSVGDQGMRRNDAGDVLTLDILINASSSATLSAIIENFAANLRLTGVDARIEAVDPAQYTSRERDRDYDMIFDAYRPFLGVGTGLKQVYGADQAAFSLFNPAGVGSPLIDAVIDKALEAQTRDEETAALRALDRVLRHEAFMIPVWYNDKVWVAYYDMYRRPENLPKYATGELDFWWYDEDAAKRLRDAGALR